MGQTYQCGYCGTEKWLPEHPTTGQQRVRTGCDECSTTRAHYAVGRAQWHLRKGVPTYGGET